MDLVYFILLYWNYMVCVCVCVCVHVFGEVREQNDGTGSLILPGFWIKHRMFGLVFSMACVASPLPAQLFC